MVNSLEWKVHLGGRRGSERPSLGPYAIQVSPYIQGIGIK